jgi:hypothetical protein
MWSMEEFSSKPQVGEQNNGLLLFVATVSGHFILQLEQPA